MHYLLGLAACVRRAPTCQARFAPQLACLLKRRSHRVLAVAICDSGWDSALRQHARAIAGSFSRSRDNVVPALLAAHRRIVLACTGGAVGAALAAAGLAVTAIMRRCDGENPNRGGPGDCNTATSTQGATLASGLGVAALLLSISASRANSAKRHAFPVIPNRFPRQTATATATTNGVKTRTASTSQADERSSSMDSPQPRISQQDSRSFVRAISKRVGLSENSLFGETGLEPAIHRALVLAWSATRLALVALLVRLALAFHLAHSGRHAPYPRVGLEIVSLLLLVAAALFTSRRVRKWLRRALARYHWREESRQEVSSAAEVARLVGTAANVSAPRALLRTARSSFRVLHWNSLGQKDFLQSYSRNLAALTMKVTLTPNSHLAP
jgi:hypothetical protein